MNRPDAQPAPVEAASVEPRPTVAKRDQRGRLDCAAGPALAYADGWSVCVVEGVRLRRLTRS